MQTWTIKHEKGMVNFMDNKLIIQMKFCKKIHVISGYLNITYEILFRNSCN